MWYSAKYISLLMWIILLSRQCYCGECSHGQGCCIYTYFTGIGIQFSEAKQSCEDNGGSLAILNTNSAMDAAQDVYQICSKESCSNCWIGAEIINANLTWFNGEEVDMDSEYWSPAYLKRDSYLTIRNHKDKESNWETHYDQHLDCYLCQKSAIQCLPETEAAPAYVPTYSANPTPSVLSNGTYPMMMMPASEDNGLISCYFVVMASGDSILDNVNLTQEFVDNIAQYNDTVEDGQYYFAYATERFKESYWIYIGTGNYTNCSIGQSTSRSSFYVYNAESRRLDIATSYTYFVMTATYVSDGQFSYGKSVNVIIIGHQKQYYWKAFLIVLVLLLFLCIFTIAVMKYFRKTPTFIDHNDASNIEATHATQNSPQSVDNPIYNQAYSGDSQTIQNVYQIRGPIKGDDYWIAKKETKSKA